jgi:hypothetical protein
VLDTFLLGLAAPIGVGAQGKMPGPLHWNVDQQGKHLDNVDVVYAMRHEPGHWTAVAAVNRQETVTIYYRSSTSSCNHAARATMAMAQYLAKEATRQSSQNWPKNPQDYVLVDRSSAPQQPDGDSYGCCVLMDLEALCAGTALAGCFRRRSNYTSLDVAQWRARWQCSLLRETHSAQTPPPTASPPPRGRSGRSAST